MISLVIPADSCDQTWQYFLPAWRRRNFEQSYEVFLCLPWDGFEQQVELLESFLELGEHFHLVLTGRGRARQLNGAAQYARGETLWFLHGDSRINLAKALGAIERRVQRNQFKSLWYFDLDFYDGPWTMILNRWGVRFRSRILGIPFGDQGFVIDKKQFFAIGMYRTDLRFGEDHVFVWQARLHGVRVRSLGMSLATSARKYRLNGWLRTTFHHLMGTVTQAWPWARQLFRHIPKQIKFAKDKGGGGGKIREGEFKRP